MQRAALGTLGLEAELGASGLSLMMPNDGSEPFLSLLYKTDKVCLRFFAWVNAESLFSYRGQLSDASLPKFATLRAYSYTPFGSVRAGNLFTW